MQVYCNQLGMVVDLEYCVFVNEGVPCRNIIGCFEGRMDIGAFLREKFSDEELKRAFGGLPKTRLERIMESIKLHF